MTQLLGFGDGDVDEAGAPYHERYWKNIIPEHFDFVDNRKNNESQEWESGYYYPVLPKIDYETNTFIDELQADRIPFGTSGRTWNEDDKDAPITNENLQDSNLEINYDMANLNVESIEDKSGNKNIGIVIGDYRLGFNEKRQVTRGDTVTRPSQEKDKRSF